MRIPVRAILGIAATCLGVALAASPALAQGTGLAQRKSLEHGQDLSRQEAEIRRTRAVIKRIVRDRRASDEVKQQAADLEGLLGKRQEIIDRLQVRQKEFATQHQAEIAELDDLRRRARELDDRLGAARKSVLESSKEDVTTLKDVSARAADIADGLRTRYLEERRGNRGRPARGNADQR